MKAPFLPSSRRGSIIIMVMIIGTALSVTIASLLNNATTEARINESHFLNLSAKNAAESVLDYGVSQLTRRWENQSSFRDNELQPGNRPLETPAELMTFLQKSNTITSKVELVGGVIPPNTDFFVNPNDPANQGDPHLGKKIQIRNVELFAQATVQNDAGTQERSAYVTQIFQLRDASLFSHAIFYNMDLEFHPGPNMVINGPVHSNGDIWALAISGLEFRGNITTSGSYYTAMKSRAYQTQNAEGEWRGDWGGTNEGSQTGKKVWILDADGVKQHNYKGGNEKKQDSYWDSSTKDGGFAGALPGSSHDVETWRAYAKNRWDGFVQTSDHSVPNLQPVGYDPHVADETDDGINTMRNPAYALIEPYFTNQSDPNNYIPSSEWTSYYKSVGEEEKFSKISSLTIRMWEEDPFLRFEEDRDSDGTMETYYVDRHRTWDKNSDGTITKDEFAEIPDNAIRLRRRPEVEDGWSSAQMEQYLEIEDDDADGLIDPIADADVAKLDPRLYNTNYFLSFHRIVRSDPNLPNSAPVTTAGTYEYVKEDGSSSGQLAAEFIQEEKLYPADHGWIGIDREGEDPIEESSYADRLNHLARAYFDETFAALPYIEETPDYDGDEPDKDDRMVLGQREFLDGDWEDGLFPDYIVREGILEDTHGDYLFETHWGDLNGNGVIDYATNADGSRNLAAALQDGDTISEAILGDIDKNGDTLGVFTVSGGRVSETSHGVDFNADGDTNDNVRVRDIRVHESHWLDGPMDMNGNDNKTDKIKLSDLRLSEHMFGDLNGDGDADDFFSKLRANSDTDTDDLVSGLRDDRIYDHSSSDSSRTKSKVNLIDINMTALHRMLEHTDWYTLEDKNGVGYDAATTYNGAIYFEMPLDAEAMKARQTHGSSEWRPERVSKAIDNHAVILREAGGGTSPYGTTQQVPDPSYLGVVNRDRGFTFASNGPLYTHGHFNADGKSDTGSNVMPDDASSPEIPLALAGDAVTILSPNFLLRNSRSVNSPDAAMTEFSGAIVSGLFPTSKDGKSDNKSGGSHNFPRFLERWSGKEFRYRGSLIALFESEVQNQRWQTGYYSPPKRNWGFYDEFAQGNYPPGPNVRSYKTIDFRFLTAEEYNERVQAVSVPSS